MDTLHKILELLWKSGLSELEFCQKAGINKSAVTEWKKGKTKSYLKHIPKIAKVLGTTEDYLLKEEEKTILDGQSLSKKQKQLLDIAEKLTDEEQARLLEYAELLKKAQS